MRLLPSLIIVGALASPAFAHFKLMEPESFAIQDMDGNPQKTAPCGGSAFDPSNYVTQVQTGSTINIKVLETVPHPGHYRVSLAQNISDLPPDPAVNNPSVCGSLDIDPSPTLPLLADGLLVHTNSFNGVPQTMQVQLPAGMKCTSCVLQIQEFMSAHGSPCFYHHCAMITITDTPVNDPPPTGTPDAGPTAGDAGTSAGPATDGGCSAGTGVGIVIGLAGLGLYRRRRAR
jgi:uncharacterized protein (TIGR03382 family)